MTGKNFFGVCSYNDKSNYDILEIIQYFIYIPLTYLYIKILNSVLPSKRVADYLKIPYLIFLKIYLLTDCILWGVYIIAIVVVTLNCTYFHTQDLTFFITLGNISKALLTLINPILRITYDPSLSSLIFKSSGGLDHEYLSSNC